MSEATAVLEQPQVEVTAVPVAHQVNGEPVAEAPAQEPVAEAPVEEPKAKPKRAKKALRLPFAVREDDARRFLTAWGMENAETATVKQLEAKLNKVAGEDAPQLERVHDREFLNLIIEQSEQGMKIVIGEVADVAATAEEPTEEPKPKAKKAAKPKAKPAAKAAKAQKAKRKDLSMKAGEVLVRQASTRRF